MPAVSSGVRPGELAWRAGADVVFAIRKAREGETAFKLFTAKLFYKLIRKLSAANIRGVIIPIVPITPRRARSRGSHGSPAAPSASRHAMNCVIRIVAR